MYMIIDSMNIIYIYRYSIVAYNIFTGHMICTSILMSLTWLYFMFPFMAE